MSEKTDLTRAREHVEKIKATDVSAGSQLPFDLLNGKSKKTTKLLANSGSTSPIDGSSRWYQYTFTKPVCLQKIVVEEEGYSRYSEFEFCWTPAQGDEVSQKLSKNDDGTYQAPINQLVSQVSFKPPKQWLTKTKITRVQLIGFQMEELEEFLQLVEKIDLYKSNAVAEANKAIKSGEEANQKVEKAELELDELKNKIAKANQEIANISADIGRLTEQRQGLLDDITNREETLSNLDERRSEIQATINERTTERESLAGAVGKLKQQLRALEDDVNMFPTEIGAFVSQGGQNIRTYWKLAAVPIALMVIMTGLLVFDAANLTTVLDEVDGAKIWSILLTRVPYVIIVTAIIMASYKLTRIFVAEIMRINQQKLNLSKISIIATDASNASQEGLNDLTDQDLYELRTDLKMQLLRDHLKEYLSSDFSYQGKSTNNLVPLLEKRKMPKTTDTEDEQAIKD